MRRDKVTDFRELRGVEAGKARSDFCIGAARNRIDHDRKRPTPLRDAPAFPPRQYRDRNQQREQGGDAELAKRHERIVGAERLVGVTLSKPSRLAYTRTMLRRVANFYFLLACMLAPGAFAQEKVEVITLRYHQAEDLIPSLLPLVAPNGAITGMRNHLIVRAEPAQHAAVKRVLETLDAPPRQLEITVRQNTDRAALLNEAGLYGRAQGEHGRVVIGGRPPIGAPRIEGRGSDGRIGAYLNERNTNSQSRDSQTLRVLEGRPAFIRVGQSLPYAARSVYVHPYGTTIVDGTDYVDVITGFEVLPRVSGDRVTLHVRPQKNSPGPRGSINIQAADTVLSARLGEWIELGGANTSESDSASGLLSRREGGTAERRSIFIRVDEVR